LIPTAGWLFFLLANIDSREVAVTPDATSEDATQQGATSEDATSEDAAPPDAARAIFGAMLPVAQAYAELLVGPGVERGLIGPGEAARVWDRHLLNSAVIAELVPVPGRLADLGSGAGLPGIVLAMLLPEAEVILVEPMARRTMFLQECVASLGLSNVQIRRGRAEDLTGQIDADVVTARAVAPLDRLAAMAAGLTRPGGLVLAIKGVTAARELDHALPVLRRLGATGIELVSAGTGRISQPATVIRFTTGSRAGQARPAGRGRGTGGTNFRPGARR
jgi:16S rRNA (guanine527-N7)-methyltransferase